VFVDRLSRLRDEPKKNRMIINCQYILEKPTNASITLNASAPISIMRLLLNAESNRLVNGKVMNRPIGKANNAAPNWALLRWSCCCRSGMRDVQVV